MWKVMYDHKVAGLPVSTSFLVKKGEAYVMSTGDPVTGTRNPTVLMHPEDWMIAQNNGRFPFWTRHMAGVSEAERDRRLRKRNR